MSKIKEMFSVNKFIGYIIAGVIVVVIGGLILNVISKSKPLNDDGYKTNNANQGVIVSGSDNEIGDITIIENVPAPSPTKVTPEEFPINSLPDASSTSTPYQSPIPIAIYTPEKDERAIYIQTMLALIQVYSYHDTELGNFSLSYSEDGCTYTDPLEIEIIGLDEVEGELWETDAAYIQDGIYRVEVLGDASRLRIRSRYFTYTTSFEHILTSSYYAPDEYYISNLKLLTVFPKEDSLDYCLSIKNIEYDARSKNYVVNLDRSSYGREPIDHFKIAKGNYLITYKDGRQKTITINESGVLDFSY